MFRKDEIRTCPKCSGLIKNIDGRTDCYGCDDCNSKFTIEEYGE